MNKFILTIIFAMASLQLCAQDTSSLQKELLTIIAGKTLTAGISIKCIESRDTLTINGNLDAPLMSVFKFHIALAVLDRVDKGTLLLTQNIFIKKEALHDNTWSPMRDEHPDGNLNLTLDQVLRYTVSHSDNNGCDILLELIGGTETVQKFINKQGISDFTIKVNEEQMKQPGNIYLNKTTPLAATQLLEKFYKGEVLKKETTDYLYLIMTETSRGTTWLKAGLPESTPFAHRTGTSGTDENNITAAKNDIGIITLPDGSHVILSAFLNNISEPAEDTEKILADIAKATWKHFTEK